MKRTYKLELFFDFDYGGNTPVNTEVIFNMLQRQLSKGNWANTTGSICCVNITPTKMRNESIRLINGNIIKLSGDKDNDP